MTTAIDWVKRLGDANLPVLARTGRDIAARVQEVERLRPAEIADLVIQDPLLTLRVILNGNQQRSRHMSQEITTVSHAIMMHGTQRFFLKLAEFPTVESRLRQRPEVIAHLEQLADRAWLAAVQARDFAALRTDRDPEEIAIAAVLADIPELLLWLVAPEAAQQIDSARRSGQDELDAQRQVLGTTFTALQQQLAAAWPLPEMLRVLTDREQIDRPRVRGVQLAGRIAHHMQQGAPAEALDEDIQTIAEWLQIPPDEVGRIVQRNAAIAGHELTDEPAHVPAPDAPPPDPVHMARVDDVLHYIQAHLDGSLDLHAMMMQVLTGIHEGVGLKRVVFALLTPDRRRLTAKYLLGVAPGSPLAHVAVPMAPPNLFSRLMEKTQAVWLSDANRANLAVLIPDTLRGFLGHGEFFAMSLFAHGKPIGLIYADDGQTGKPLDERRYALFKRLCLGGAQGLEHLSGKTARA